MAVVRITASIPSRRIRLARMLAAGGHRVLGADQPTDPAVWVVDLTEGAPLEATLAKGRKSFGLVVLSDDPHLWTRLAHSHLAGWALLPRDLDGADLDLAVQAAEGGLALFGHPAAAAFGATTGKPCRGAPGLTGREQEVLQLIAEGLPNKGIARALGVSENTVKFHVASICGKLDARSRTEAVTIAARGGLLLL